MIQDFYSRKNCPVTIDYVTSAGLVDCWARDNMGIQLREVEWCDVKI